MKWNVSHLQPFFQISIVAQYEIFSINIFLYTHYIQTEQLQLISKLWKRSNSFSIAKEAGNGIERAQCHSKQSSKWEEKQKEKISTWYTAVVTVYPNSKDTFRSLQESKFRTSSSKAVMMTHINQGSCFRLQPWVSHHCIESASGLRYFSPQLGMGWENGGLFHLWVDLNGQGFQGKDHSSICHNLWLSSGNKCPNFAASPISDSSSHLSESH